MTGHTEQHEAGERCRVCGSADLEWATTQTINSGVVQNRLNTNDVTCVFYLGCNTCSETLRTVTADDVAAMLNAAQPTPAPDSEAMTLEVALDFADNPRPHHSLAAPADTNGELYEALRVIAAAYRASLPPAGGWQQEQLEAMRRALKPFARLAGPINGEEGRPTYLEAISGPNGTDELELRTYVGDGTRTEVMDAADFRAALAALAQPTGEQPEAVKNDAFLHGFLIACSSLAGGYGETTLAEYLLQEVGDVTEADFDRLDLCDYDRDNLLPIIAEMRAKKSVQP